MAVEVNATFSDMLTFGASFTESGNANADFEAIVVTAPIYDGDYIVIPQADREQVLQTNGKRMTDDVSVRKIPYFQTSNVTGDTVYIASEA